MTITEKAEQRTSTEARVKEAARKLFTSKGYAAVKTRDIAAEAGINPALIHYYFRSKEKLFGIIMIENLNQLKDGVAGIVNDEATSIERKFESLVSLYIDTLMRNPDLPLFILNEAKSNPREFFVKIKIMSLIKDSFLIKQLQAADKLWKQLPFDPLHLLINFAVLTVGPVVGLPMLNALTGMDQPRLALLMEERKTLIPKWIKAMAQSA